MVRGRTDRGDRRANPALNGCSRARRTVRLDRDPPGLHAPRQGALRRHLHRRRDRLHPAPDQTARRVSDAQRSRCERQRDAHKRPQHVRSAFHRPRARAPTAGRRGRARDRRCAPARAEAQPPRLERADPRDRGRRRAPAVNARRGRRRGRPPGYARGVHRQPPPPGRSTSTHAVPPATSRRTRVPATPS